MSPVPSALDRVRRKIEAGEPLEEREWEVLRAAARDAPGPTLRLALAHARVNAGAEREALPLLEALRRDFPNDVPVRLGQARALLGLERMGEAEAVLREALVLQPGDPEVLKVLAVLALRRGEHGRARALVADALSRDPTDSEARLLQGELDAIGPDTAPPAVPPLVPPLADRAEFLAALLAALHRAGVACRRQGAHLLVKLASGQVGRLDVDSLHADSRTGARPLADSVAELVARLGRLSGAEGPVGAEGPLGPRVRPVLRPAGFAARATGALHRAAGAGLEVFYVLEDEAFVRYVPEGSLGPAGLSALEVDTLAWANLEAHPAPMIPVGVEAGRVVLGEARTGVWAVAGGDGLDGARLLTGAQRRRLVTEVGEGPWCVQLGWREFALVCREADGAAREVLGALGAAPEGIPGLFRLADGGLEAG